MPMTLDKFTKSCERLVSTSEYDATWSGILGLDYGDNTQPGCWGLKEIQEVVAAFTNDEREEYLGCVALLKDGRWGVGEAWCDYTGWD